MLLKIFFAVTAMTAPAFAQESLPLVSPETPPVKTEARRIDEAKNYFQFALKGGSTADPNEDSESHSTMGGSLGYYYRVSPRFLIGASYSYNEGELGDSSERDCSGDLVTGQCYAYFGRGETHALDLNALFYFRENGYKKWGPYLHSGVGIIKNETSGNFYRYDKDPGIFCDWFGGDCKRLQESGTEKKNKMTTTQVKLGAGYQFIWTPNRAISGHILDLGFTGTYAFAENQINVMASNGIDREMGFGKFTAQLSVSYMFVF